MATTDRLSYHAARELARSDRCVGCEGTVTTRRRSGEIAMGLGGLWCLDCWELIDADPFTIPDLLDGGEALRADG